MDPPEGQPVPVARIEPPLLTFKQQSSSALLEDIPEARNVTSHNEPLAVAAVVVTSADLLSDVAEQQRAMDPADPPAQHTMDLTEYQQQQQPDPFSAHEEAGKLRVSSRDDNKETTAALISLTKQSRSTPSPLWNRRNLMLFLVVVLVAVVTIGLSVGLTRSKHRIIIQPLLIKDGDSSRANLGSAVVFARSGNTLAAASGGSVAVFGKLAESWVRKGQDIVIVSPDPHHHEFFGQRNVISIDLNESGDYIVVGYSRGGMDNVGFVQIHYFFEEVGKWGKIADLSFGIAGDRFGASVSINDVGDVIAVGAPGYQNNTGRVYSFRELEDGSRSWAPRRGDIEGRVVDGTFGGSVSLSGIGDRIVVGGRTVIGASALTDEVVQIYEFGRHTNFTWSRLGSGLTDHQIRLSTTWTVDISEDGMRYVASSSYTKVEDFDNRIPDSLVVQVHEFDGTAWIKMGENIHQGASGPKSGYFVALASDGLSMAMGDPGIISDAGNGHAHIYKFVDGKQWVRYGPNVEGEGRGDLFGYSVAITGDGTHFAIGAPLQSFVSANDAGGVRTYTLPNA